MISLAMWYLNLDIIVIHKMDKSRILITIANIHGMHVTSKHKFMLYEHYIVNSKRYCCYYPTFTA